MWRTQVLDQVFVAMSFESRFAERFDDVIKPAIEEGELKIDWEDEVFANAVLTRDGETKHEATREAIDENGWLHTGDVAEFVDGHICIRGRIKAIIVMSTGEKTPPADLELAISLDPLFEQAMVVGEGRSYLSALLVLNPDAWQQPESHETRSTRTGTAPRGHPVAPVPHRSGRR